MNKALLLLFLFVTLAALSIYRHRNIPPDTFRSEIWADRAGYHVYLPATFIHGFDPAAFPENIEKRTGVGFSLGTGRVVTKYTYGVALLQLPFFLIADLITRSSDLTRDGYSDYYRYAVDIAAVCYLVLGGWLLFLSLRAFHPHSSRISWITVVVVFLGTNLYYYGIVETGMSHVYSFFLFCGVLYLLTHQHVIHGDHGFHLLFSALIGLIVLIRPTNIVFAAIAIFWLFHQRGSRDLFRVRTILIWLFVLVVLFLPQAIYWEYVSGSFISYSYGNEGFSNALSPKLGEVLFSPENGLLPYSLAMIWMLVGTYQLIRQRSIIGWFALTAFVSIWYMTASWHDRSFGCGAGMRNMVEYFALLAFPLCTFLGSVERIRLPLRRWALMMGVAITVIISFKVNYHFFGCYFSGTWDPSDYIQTLIYPLGK